MPKPEFERLALEWLRFAEDDLVLARSGLTRRRIFQPRQVCFHAQQAAEKAIKSRLVAEQIPFRFIHDLEELSQLLPPSVISATTVTDLAWLSQWATATRYPGSAEPTWADARTAVEIADVLAAGARTSLEPT
jgi:HEPN domain-containing protein